MDKANSKDQNKDHHNFFFTFLKLINYCIYFCVLLFSANLDMLSGLSLQCSQKIAVGQILKQCGYYEGTFTFKMRVLCGY